MLELGLYPGRIRTLQNIFCFVLRPSIGLFGLPVADWNWLKGGWVEGDLSLFCSLRCYIESALSLRLLFSAISMSNVSISASLSWSSIFRFWRLDRPVGKPSELNSRIGQIRYKSSFNHTHYIYSGTFPKQQHTLQTILLTITSGGVTNGRVNNANSQN